MGLLDKIRRGMKGVVDILDCGRCDEDEGLVNKLLKRRD